MQVELRSVLGWLAATVLLTAFPAGALSKGKKGELKQVKRNKVFAKEKGVRGTWAACLETVLAVAGREVEHSRLVESYLDPGRGPDLSLEHLPLRLPLVRVDGEASGLVLHGSALLGAPSLDVLKDVIDAGHPVMAFVGEANPWKKPAHLVLVYGYSPAKAPPPGKFRKPVPDLKLSVFSPWKGLGFKKIQLYKLAPSWKAALVYRVTEARAPVEASGLRGGSGQLDAKVVEQAVTPGGKATYACTFTGTTDDQLDGLVVVEVGRTSGKAGDDDPGWVQLAASPRQLTFYGQETHELKGSLDLAAPGADDRLEVRARVVGSRVGRRIPSGKEMPKPEFRRGVGTLIRAAAELFKDHRGAVKKGKEGGSCTYATPLGIPGFGAELQIRCEKGTQDRPDRWSCHGKVEFKGNKEQQAREYFDLLATGVAACIPDGWHTELRGEREGRSELTGATTYHVLGSFDSSEKESPYDRYGVSLDLDLWKDLPNEFRSRVGYRVTLTVRSPQQEHERRR